MTYRVLGSLDWLDSNSAGAGLAFCVIKKLGDEDRTFNTAASIDLGHKRTNPFVES